MPDAAMPRFDALPPAARAVMRVFAFLSSQPVQREWCFEPGVSAIILESFSHPDNNPEPATCPDDFPQALTALEAASVVTAKDDSIAFPNKVLEAARAWIPKGEQRLWLERTLRLVDSWTPDHSDDPTTWERMGQLEPHLTRVLEFAEAERIAHPTGGLMAQKLGVYLYLIGQVARAEKLIRRGLELDETHFGPEHPMVAVDLNNLAYVLTETGRASETEPMKIRVVEILMRHQDVEPEKFVTALGNLAGMLRDQGRLEDAENLYRKAVVVAEQRLGATHPTLARELRSLSGLLARTNRLPEAEDCVRQALAIDEKALGNYHPNIAADLNLLASILAGQGKVEGLDRLFQRALEIRRRWYSGNSAEVTSTLLDLAYAFERQGKTDEAVSAYQEIIRGCDAQETVDSLPLILSLFEVGVAAMNRRDLITALPLLRRALTLAQATFGPTEPRTESIRRALIEALSQAGDVTEARRVQLAAEEELLRRRIEVAQDKATAYDDYALFLKNERNDFDGAERWYRKALELAPGIPRIMNNLAVLLTTVYQQHDEAEHLYRRAIELAPGDALFIGNYAALIHNVRRRFAEAAQLYELALEAAPNDVGILANYAALLLILGRDEEAGKLLDRAWGVQHGRHDRLSARVLFVKAAAEMLRHGNPDLCLGQLKTLFRHAISHVPWAADALLDFLNQRLPSADAGFFHALASAIGHNSALPDLERIPRWRALAETGIDVPWGSITSI